MENTWMPGEALERHDAMNMFQESISVAAKACRRWNVDLAVPAGADLATAGRIVREALLAAATAASKFDEGPFYIDDYPSLVAGLPGLSQDSLRLDLEAKMGSSSGDEWGILARIESGEVSFDVPIIYGIDEDACRRILFLLDGRESEFVDLDFVSSMFDLTEVEVRFHAGNWASLKDISKTGALPLDLSIMFRRPVVWDLFRAELSGLPARDLPEFSEKDFYARYMLSVRHDEATMESSRRLVRILAQSDAEPLSEEWSLWFPPLIEMMSSIGKPKHASGLSVVLNFVGEEPLEVEGWAPVSTHTMLVACGLDPIAASQLHEFVRRNPDAFYNLPASSTKRFRLMGASVISDAMLAAHRVSIAGRTNAYDRLVEMHQLEA